MIGRLTTLILTGLALAAPMGCAATDNGSAQARTRTKMMDCAQFCREFPNQCIGRRSLARTSLSGCRVAVRITAKPGVKTEVYVVQNRDVVQADSGGQP